MFTLGYLGFSFLFCFCLFLFVCLFFSVGGSCDEPLGMKDGSITNAQITASSHSVDGEPFEARLDGDNAWIPWMMLS